MGTIDDYLKTLQSDDAAVIGRLFDVARAEEPDTQQGKSYGMPALLYRNKPLLSVMRTKRHIGLYPYSNDAVLSVADRLGGLDTAKGTIRFQPEAPPSDEVIRDLVRFRCRQIDG